MDTPVKSYMTKQGSLRRCLGMISSLLLDDLYSGIWLWYFTSGWLLILCEAVMNMSWTVRTPSDFPISSAKAGMKWFLWASCPWSVDNRRVVFGILFSTWMFAQSSLPDSARDASVSKTASKISRDWLSSNGSPR